MKMAENESSRPWPRIVDRGRSLRLLQLAQEAKPARLSGELITGEMNEVVICIVCALRWDAERELREANALERYGNARFGDDGKATTPGDGTIPFRRKP